jgi:Domain of Unknown Function (DUF1206)
MTVRTSDARGLLMEHRGWVETLARAGYATRGALYVIVGGLAALAAFGYGGETTDTKGALLELYRQPFGALLLVLAATGLAGYGTFLACRAALDPEREAQRTWGPAKRAWWATMAVVHGSLAVWALSMVLGAGSGEDGDDRARGVTALLLAWRPLGPWLVAGVGVGFVVGAGHGFYCAFEAKLDEALDLSRLSTTARRWAVGASRLGLAARACVSLAVGVFFIVAAWRSNPNEAKGFADSLGALRALPFGSAVFAAVSLGLIAFGVYQLIQARYRRILVEGGSAERVRG